MTRYPFLVVTAVAACLLGCPGTLENPERFTGGGPPVVEDFACTSGADPIADIVVPKCQAACHNATANLGMLNMDEAGLAERLVNVEAAECAGQILVPTDGTTESYLINKVKADSPACGSKMPQGVPLSAAELTCFEEWVAHLAKGT